jgi:hypothetical protein
VPLSQVHDLLGHASIVTTERYDNQTQDALLAAANRLVTNRSRGASQETSARPPALSPPETGLPCHVVDRSENHLFRETPVPGIS